jgi:hypothetical protein
MGKSCGELGLRVFTVPRSSRSSGVAALLLGALAATVGCGDSEGDDGGAGTAGSAGRASGGSAGSGGSTRGGEGGMPAKGGTSSSAGTGATAGKSGSGGKGGAANSSGGSGGSTNGGSSGKAGASGTGGGAGGGKGSSVQAEVAEKLGREPNFLIGLGNDLAQDHNNDGAYTLGTTLDLHYAYLVGLQGEGGWPDWNPDGSFVNVLTDTAAAHGVTPMFDLYTMASRGEANLDPLATDEFMQKYWNALRLLYERLAIFDGPALVHLEPDFWAFAQQQSGGDPSTIAARVGTIVPECEGEPENLVGLGHCIKQLRDNIAPKTLIAYHASHWAGDTPAIVSFLNAVGAGETDLIVMDLLDRDAGCFEAHVDPNCQRNDGPWYWDETNTTSPNFHEYIEKSKAIGDGLGLPILWWQIPLGVPSDEPGGVAGSYRDNRVRYIFNHIQEFIDAGGVGAAFGTGAANQTFITTDGGQFQNAVTAYYADPAPLP